MSLRRKTLAFVVLSVAALMGATLWVIDGVVMSEFARAEREDVAHKVADVQAVVQRCVQEYGQRFADWTDWDDMDQYLADGNQAFLDSNVSLSALADQIHADFFVVERTDGTRVHAVQVNQARDALEPCAERILRHLDARGLMRPGDSFAGLLAFPDCTYVVSSRPIRKSDGTPGPVEGRLVTGERLNQAWIERLKGFTFLELSFTRTAETPIENEELGAREALAAGATSHVAETSPSCISGYGLLDDIYGSPALVLHVACDREMLERAHTILGWTMYTLLGGGLVLAGCAFFFVRRGLLRPLQLLLDGTRTLREGRHTQVILRTSDEFQDLARNFNAMSDAILEREEALTRAHLEIARVFDGMAQAIVAFDAEGRVSGRASRAAHELFAREDLEGVRLCELFFPDADEFDVEAEAFQAWLTVVFTQPLDSWSAVCELAPRRVVLRPGSAREAHLALEFRALVQDGRLQRVILIATDETEKVRLLAEQAERESAHERQMQAMRKLLAGGAQMFAGFVRSSRERLDEMGALLAARPQALDAADVDLLFRHAHTIKGEARVFDIVELEKNCGELEDILVELREGARGGSVDCGKRLTALNRLVISARTELVLAQELFVRASPIGEAILDQISVRRSDVEALEGLTNRLVDELGNSLAWSVHELVERIHSRPFGEICSSFTERVPQWAQKLDKRVQLEVVGREVPIPPLLARRLPGVLTHMLRNSISHGIETPSEREAAGKAAIGTVRLVATQDECGPRILVEDDGRGLNPEALSRKARELGLPCTPGEEWRLIFAPGLSTADEVDEYSGRGVGMHAVQTELAGAGYETEVESRRGEYTRMTLRLKFCSLHAAPTIARRAPESSA